jgi:hypothetical protein
MIWTWWRMSKRITLGTLNYTSFLYPRLHGVLEPWIREAIFVWVVVVRLAFVSLRLGTFFCLAFIGLRLGTFFRQTSVRLLFDRTFVRLAFVSLLLGVSMVGNSIVLFHDV